MVFLGMKPEHQNFPLGNSGPPLAGCLVSGGGAQQLGGLLLGSQGWLACGPSSAESPEYLLKCRFHSPFQTELVITSGVGPWILHCDALGGAGQPGAAHGRTRV